MLLSEPLASLIMFFRTSVIQFYHNSQRMSDSFYHITESNESNKKIRLQNILISPCPSAMFWDFCVGIQRYSALTYDVIKSYLTRVRDKKIRNGYITLETSVVM